MHVAAAVRTLAVIVYGDRSRPQEVGYACHVNIVRSPACVGCALNFSCPNGMTCVEIQAEAVEVAVHTQSASNPLA